MHSLPVMIPVLVVVLGYGWRTNRIRVAVAYSVGHFLHPLGDLYPTLLGGAVPANLLWPFVSVPAGADPVWINDWTMFSVVVLAIVSVMLVVDLRAQLHARRTAAN
jgi:hypothetical protein